MKSGAAISCHVPKHVDPWRFARGVARVMEPCASVVLYDFAKPKGLPVPFPPEAH
ncbi:MAG: hypothetical protein JRN08_08915 [Nitrososphaerota archaeon]|nr:hypothetical protein [Nitrososphaerota archaeon]